MVFNNTDKDKTFSTGCKFFASQVNFSLFKNDAKWDCFQKYKIMEIYFSKQKSESAS